MMVRAFYLAAFGLLAATPVTWAGCEDLQNLSLPLSGDATLELSSDAIDCAILEDNELEEFVIEGGTLTLTGPSTTKFTNLKFTVMDGAGLIFDFDTTEFGPNLGFDLTDSFSGFMVQVLSGGSVLFTGEMFATGLTNMRSVFSNNEGGNIEFGSGAVFDECGSNVFRDQLGRLRFRGDATFTNNRLLAIDNIGGTISFRGLATFADNRCDESGGGAYNGEDSKMTFYKKASFNDNRCRNAHGGGIANEGGILKFRAAVEVTFNEAEEFGGGIATGEGGTTTFYSWTSIQLNTVYSNGGGMSLYGDGENVVTFRRPDRMRISNNEKTGADVGCNNIHVGENSELIGPDSTTDICDES